MKFYAFSVNFMLFYDFDLISKNLCFFYILFESGWLVSISTMWLASIRHILYVKNLLNKTRNVNFDYQFRNTRDTSFPLRLDSTLFQ